MAFRLFNAKSDLFATIFSFAGQAIIRLCSSLILTRILNPDAYGTITVLMSIGFVVEMLADIGVTVFIVRDKHAEEPRYLNTAWTLRLGRAVVNSGILFACGPLISSSLYHLPDLEVPLRVFSLWFIIAGLESMSFPLAIRHKRSRIVMYSELTATLLSTLFSIAYCEYSRNYWGLVYGILLNRLLITAFSYLFYKEQRPRLQFDRLAARDMLGMTKFTMPSSLLMLAVSQFDKIVFLRLFDLTLLGVYGLAGNIANPIETLIGKISQTVLYPRCAHNFRNDPQSFSLKFYTENVKFFFTILILPVAVGGAAQLIIAVLYPARYAGAAMILQAFMIRAAVLGLANPAEDMLVAAGEAQVMLVGNVLRAIWTVAASLIGYHFFGFLGFTYGVALNNVPPMIYWMNLQRKKGMLIAKYEVYKVVFAIVVALSAYMASHLILTVWPTLKLKT
jgi:lipopolysaccharide exporter